MSTLKAAFKLQQGATPIIWASSGGTFVWTPTSLSDGTGREGPKADLGAKWARRWVALLTSSVAASATDFKAIELWWGPSDNATAGTDNPGNLSGTDATLTNAATLRYQLLLVGSLSLVNARTTSVQKQWFDFYPPLRYGVPLLYNASGQALGSTAADHTLTLIPLEETAEDGIT
jgi:hypothetical protein